jgi:hypothetical protein
MRALNTDEISDTSTGIIVPDFVRCIVSNTARSPAAARWPATAGEAVG